MIFSEQWIREWVNPPLTTQQLIDQLTMAGLEVDGHEPVAGAFIGVVVAEVMAVQPHPDADKLRVCNVNDGTQIVQVVCGATNVRPGLKVPFARIGAHLADKDNGAPLNIKQAKLRGVESNGMLCSAQELGIAESADGLLELPEDAPNGMDIREYLHLDDCSLELDLTPNRGDCLGIIGLAREIGVLNGITPELPEMPAVAPVISDVIPVSVQAQEQCPCYLGRVIRGVNASASTPLWMQETLRRCGLRSIDPVVDVTNYVLLELGQPMHAFDLAHLHGGVSVRLARASEKLVLLDGKEVTLSEDVLVIADETGPLAMAGVMGGMNSGVSTATQDVFLECAFFSPLAIVGRARRYGLHTEASHRYERGVDSGIQHLAMERATSLLVEIVGGYPGPVIETLGDFPEAVEITLSLKKVTRMLGVEIPFTQITDILVRLGMSIIEQTVDFIRVCVPSFRFDISIDVDLIEELARVYGYNKLPTTRPLSRMSLGKSTETVTESDRFKERLISLGYQEVITYSFVEPSLMTQVDGVSLAIPVQNPISADMSVMRTSLWSGLLTTLKYNANRQQERVRIFECGQVFLQQDGKLKQPSRIAGLIYGSAVPKVWCHSKRQPDFFDIKGDIESLLDVSRDPESYRFVPCQHGALHGGQSAALELNGRKIGVLGALSPALQRELNITSRVYLFEIDLESLQSAKIPKTRELSRFPEVNRDLAIVLDKAVSGGQLLQTVKDCAGETLVDLRIFDVYQGDAVEKSKKSIALGLTLQHPSRTLSEDDINGIINSCVKGLEAKFNAKLRN
ncbi:MAG: phenylalanine--tRNA ligase subunit beta [Gammaproteobacteria bacterium]|nr:phenylalanine--tRNA ligase subunit beta [Gammaproteobacteria bacterium]MDP2140909.1 phenylalanine--tRNA ligase subunit beta [Gammaproteobacteria bacterium]MDP2349347.1 phenylalanine--tRNA ligase subunit beta [Gammaproteobacteria bacterium]